MESYVEIAFIHNFLTDLLSVWMALYLVQRPLHGGRVTLYALCASAWSAFVFLDIGWIGVAAIETIGFIAVFYRQLALYGVNLLMRTLWHATAFIFGKEAFIWALFFPGSTHRSGSAGYCIWLCSSICARMP